jgi:hypothetical protein
MVEVECRLSRTRFRACSPFNSDGNDLIDNLRSGGALSWKLEDRSLGRSGSVMWQAGTSKVVAPACVG